MPYTKNFSEIRLTDLPQVGGKNSSLGEMFSRLTPKGILVPDGFAVTSAGYWYFLKEADLVSKLTSTIAKHDTSHFKNLHEIGAESRKMVRAAEFPESLKTEILRAYADLNKRAGNTVSLAVRSSATAEDLPNASFAGQQESYLNVSGEDNLIKACQRCYASLFTDRAIKYRVDNKFDHMKVALSIGVQLMVRSDIASAGVIFTLEPDSGFDDIILISGAWGLGENVVQGSVNPDEYQVYKPLLGKVKQSIVSHRLGSKLKTMTYAQTNPSEITKPEDAIVNIDTAMAKRQQFTLSDAEVIQLAEWAALIEKYYKRPMDIEWAKDGESGRLYIVQARPETVHSNRKDKNIFTEYRLKEKGKILCSGIGLGNRIAAGKARILQSPKEIDKLQKGEVLVTGRTDPDWDPVMQKAGAIVTDQGGRTSHAAIIARELGVVAIVGTGNSTTAIKDGDLITVSAAEGDVGRVYAGKLDWDEQAIDMAVLKKTKTKPMLILAHPDKAYRYSFLPNEGVGLMRMEFIISNAIGIHPMALRHFEKITDSGVRKEIEERTVGFKNKQEYFIHHLAESTAVMAAAFYPKDVIVRMSDFKSNEYAHLLGGTQFEPSEENPMIGFRGASRYYHPLYKEGFEMECAAMKRVRDDMGFTNIKLMIPFCRTIGEAQKVIELMSSFGIKRGENKLELYMMIEIPSNALLAAEFAKLFDGFSIGSIDLTQLTLGADRDSELLADIFDPFDPAVKQLIEMTLATAKKTKTHTGLCGQAPSDFPEYAAFLVENGIDSISFNPDALFHGIENITKAETQK